MTSKNRSHVNNHIVLMLCLCFVACYAKPVGGGDGGRIRGMFVFGSSLVDNGNNNLLDRSMAKADYLPYGVDFPLGPSGRFTNGRNVIDLLGEHLKLPNYLPAFTHPSTKGSNILHGVNFASGASGILDDTGALAGDVISLNQQIRNFKNVTLPELEKQIGEGGTTATTKSSAVLSQYVFVVGSGGNDYSFNYLLGLNAAYRNLSLEAFTTHLTTTLSRQLKKLYELGGRKFVLISVSPNGCSPMVKALYPKRSRKACIPTHNRAAHLFNTNLRLLVDSIKLELPGSNFVFFNSYKILMEIIKNPTKRGFSDTSNACCEVGSSTNEGGGGGGSGILCKRGGSICGNRTNHVFFDGLHPTEAVNVALANKAFASNLKSEIYPINVKQLSRI